MRTHRHTYTHTIVIFENHKVTFYCFKDQHTDILTYINKTEHWADQHRLLIFNLKAPNSAQIQACFLSHVSLSSSINRCDQISLLNNSSPQKSGHMKHRVSATPSECPKTAITIINQMSDRKPDLPNLQPRVWWSNEDFIIDCKHSNSLNWKV